MPGRFKNAIHWEQGAYLRANVIPGQSLGQPTIANWGDAKPSDYPVGCIVICRV